MSVHGLSRGRSISRILPQPREMLRRSLVAGRMVVRRRIVMHKRHSSIVRQCGGRNRRARTHRNYGQHRQYKTLHSNTSLAGGNKHRLDERQALRSKRYANNRG